MIERRVANVVLMGLIGLGAGFSKELPSQKYYDVPAGYAVNTLKEFSAVSGEQIVYLVNKVQGVKTHAVRGKYRAREVLEIMLDGTLLVPVLDQRSGAIIINRLDELPVTTKLPDDDESEEPTHRFDLSDQSGVLRLSAFSVDATTYRGYVASATLIGGKTARKILDVPQTVNVVTHDLINDIGAASPSDALVRLVPGVSNVSSTAGPAAGVYIRGFRSQNWSVDGATMRVLNGLTTFNVDAIEVIKGPASVTFGAFAAYGGYVNLLPKYANRNHRNEVKFEVGTDDFYSGMVDVGGMSGKDGNLQYRLVLGTQSYDRAGWDYDFSEARIVAPSFAYDFSDTSRVRVRFSLTNTDAKISTTALGLNGDAIRSFSSNGPSDEFHNQEDGQSMQMVWETQLNDEWSMKMNVFGALGAIDWNFNNLRSATTVAQDYLIDPHQQSYEWKNFYVDYSMAYQNAEIGNTGISYQAVGSLSMDHWDISYSLFDGNQYAPWSTRRVDPTDPDWSLLPARSEFIYPTRYIDYNTEWLGGAVMENVFGFFNDKLLLSAAVRFNYDNRSSFTRWREPRDQNPGGVYVGKPIPTNINEKTTKRFGLIYKPTDKMSIYAGSTEAFLAVGAIFRADGSRLSPETGKNEEVGVKLDLFEGLGGNFSFTGALFKINVVNKWRGDPNNPGFFIQDGEQESRGMDMQLIYTSQKFSAIMGYFNADGPTDKRTGLRAVFVPKTTWNFWAKYNLTDRLSLGGGVKHMGETISNDRRFKTAPFTTGDIFVSYKMLFRHGAMIYRAGISNLTDDDAVFSMTGASTVYREEGRRMKISASYVW